MMGEWVEEGTNQHSSREAAQRAALQALGGAIARAVRAGLEEMAQGVGAGRRRGRAGDPALDDLVARGGAGG